MTPKPQRYYSLLTAGEVAQMFGVDAKTVTRWDKAGKMPKPIKTPGGHRRWHEADIQKMLAGQFNPESVAIEDDEAPEAGRVVKLDTPWWDE